jgi:hypothetical protein
MAKSAAQGFVRPWWDADQNPFASQKIQPPTGLLLGRVPGFAAAD